ncbi:MAG: MarR family winged helix-turn-helix transcriptional regulator [Roseiarcus sp.]
MRKPRAAKLLPEPGEGKRGEEGHLGYLLRQAGAALRARMERALSDLSVTPPQFAALTMVAAYPGLSSADLARLSLLTPPTVTVIVGNLKREGALVSRPHAVHGRIRQLEITPAGKDLLARCKRRVQGVEAHIAAGLTPAEERAIRRWLVRVATESAAAGRAFTPTAAS